MRFGFDRGKSKGLAVGVADPAPDGTPEFVREAFAGTSILTQGITDLNPYHHEPRLMHDKHIIRDGETPQATVSTGSVNFSEPLVVDHPISPDE